MKIFDSLFDEFKKIFPFGIIFIILFLFLSRFNEDITGTSIAFGLLLGWNFVYLVFFIWDFINNLITKYESTKDSSFLEIHHNFKDK